MAGADVIQPGVSKADVQSAATAAADAAVAAATQGLARASDIPQPATTMPPGVAVDGDKGNAPRFALENHTHATSVQRIRMALATGQTVRWTFSKPYDAGVIPVVTGTAQNTAPITASTQPFIVNVVGAPTNTYADIVLFQARPVPQNLVSLLVGAVYSLFTTPPAGTIVNLQAAKATQ